MQTMLQLNFKTAAFPCTAASSHLNISSSMLTLDYNTRQK